MVRTCFGSFVFLLFWLCFASFCSYPLSVTFRMFCSLLFCDQVYIFVTFLVFEVLEGFGGFGDFWSQNVFGGKVVYIFVTTIFLVRFWRFCDQNVLG